MLRDMLGGRRMNAPQATRASAPPVEMRFTPRSSSSLPRKTRRAHHHIDRQSCRRPAPPRGLRRRSSRQARTGRRRRPRQRLRAGVTPRGDRRRPRARSLRCAPSAGRSRRSRRSPRAPHAGARPPRTAYRAARRGAGVILDRKTGDAGADAEPDALGDALGIAGEAGLEIGVERAVDRGDEIADVAQGIGARDAAVGQAQPRRPCPRSSVAIAGKPSEARYFADPTSYGFGITKQPARTVQFGEAAALFGNRSAS